MLDRRARLLYKMLTQVCTVQLGKGVLCRKRKRAVDASYKLVLFLIQLLCRTLPHSHLSTFPSQHFLSL